MSPIDLQDAHAVADLFHDAARASLAAECRRGATDVIEHPGTLIATGDLHDNPLHLAKLIEAAELDEDTDQGPHLTLHEIIHSDRLIANVDLSHRALARVAALKVRHPERVHVLLANHELSQVVGAGIVKAGIRVVEAFDHGLVFAYGDHAERVRDGIDAFIRAMPLALRCRTPKGDILCAHSLPDPAMMGRFDPGVLDRELTEEDYEPRRGSAHLMVWGRGYDAELLEDLVERWGVNLFVLGHEHVDNGIKLVPPCAIVLNSDHERGVYLPLDLDDIPAPERALARAVPLADAFAS